jgi:glucosyl-dolichyl phosphate glucuronosyltransferase
MSIVVSVVISTYNRGDGLRDTLESLLAQAQDSPAYEVLVVDNNSTDNTKAVIESFAARSDGRLRYLFESRQGVSFGRNTGVNAARGSIIAFTDDDVIVAADWIARIHEAFETHQDVDYLAGKLLPRFQVPPPAWLTYANTSPLTIRDAGDEPMFSVRGHYFSGWATANFGIRRAMLERSGLFATDFPRGEDLELIVRIWRANGRGMYAPKVVVTHKIPADRLTKAYHRMWHTREGDIRARVRFKEIFQADRRITSEPLMSSPLLLGSPVFLHRQLFEFGARWLMASIRRDEAQAFFNECRFRQSFSYVRTRFREHMSSGRVSLLSEIAVLPKAMLGKLRPRVGSSAP